jgi:uncharacterized membrane protein
MAESFFAKIDEPRVVEAIRLAELRSRGEIRIHVTGKSVADVMKEATAAFESLGMTRTAERNGILIFVAPASHNFAVLGDSGVTSKVGSTPLDEMAAAMSGAFREGRFTDGLVAVVEKAGELLAAHYPRAEGALDKDELENRISRG